MIHLRTDITQDTAKWVLGEIFPIFHHRVAHPTLSRIMEGHNAVFEEQVGVPGCSCEYLATHRVWTSRLSQYQPQIEAIANPPVVEQNKRGRKPKTNG